MAGSWGMPGASVARDVPGSEPETDTPFLGFLYHQKTSCREKFPIRTVVQDGTFSALKDKENTDREPLWPE
jgi:hypothetical protein